MTKIRTSTKIENVPQIGSFKPKNPFFMAPLAGVTDAPTRLIYSEMGSGLVYSEMVSAKGMHYGDRKSTRLLDILYPDDDHNSNLGDVAFQIFGSDPEIMAEAAEVLDQRENVLIDVNMGCPVPKVFKNGDGSALLKNPILCEQIISSMKARTSKPVTAKIRIGVDSSSINCVEVAKALEEGGADAICVHGRTRQAYYSGEVDYRRIAEVKESVNIPVIGNGDIFDIDSCKRMFTETGVDFVMIARGALGNPWIFKELNAWWLGESVPPRPTKEEIKDMMIYHTKLLVDYKGEKIAKNEMKKHLAWYTKGLAGSNDFRRKINNINSIKEIIAAISSF